MSPPRDPEAPVLVQDEKNKTAVPHDDRRKHHHSTAGGTKNTTFKSSSCGTTGITLIPTIPHHQSQEFIRDFSHFLTFETVSSVAASTGAYAQCAAWLVSYMRATCPFLNSIFSLPEAPANSPVIVAVWKGRDESLPCLLLNSHYDVVPATATDWTVPPFEGLRREGNVYGRGAQDMKCVGMQYLQALQLIHQQQQQESAAGDDWQPERNVYLTFVPDEEVGGSGMAAFLDSTLYKSLPSGIALALDEGLASTSDVFSVFYGERLPWWVNVTAKGPTGHGSRFIEHTAVEQILELSKKALQFRQGQREQLGLDDHSNCAHAVAAKNNKKNTKSLGDVTTLNITALQAGVKVGDTYAYNCVPPTATCSLDIRISPHMPPATMKALLDEWCHECSADVSQGHCLEWDYIDGQNGSNNNDLQQHALTSTDTEQNPWYAVFASTLSEAGFAVEPQVFPAATDSRFLRALGIRALGFSPMRNTEIMLHENDEYIPEKTYLEGIGVYAVLLKALASKGREMEERVQERMELRN